MTDREKFQKTFSKLHASPDLLTEVMEMAEVKKKNYQIPKVAVAAIACVIVLGSGTAAYAMNVGGIQRTIQLSYIIFVFLLPLSIMHKSFPVIVFLRILTTPFLCVLFYFSLIVHYVPGFFLFPIVSYR